MLSKLIAIIALAATAIAQATVQTPAAIVQCQPVAITFTGGTAPYFLSIIPGGQTQAAALEDFGTVQGSPYTWTANIPAGTSITIKITDSAGLTSYSAPVTIQAGSSSACLTTSSGAASSTSAGSSAAASSGTGVVATSAVSSATSSAAASSTTSAAAASTSAASSAAASTTSSSHVSSVASSISSAAASAVSSASSAISSAAAATSKSGAQPTGLVNAGAALALGLIGGAAALF